MIKMNFDSIAESLIKEARVRELTDDEILKKGVEYKNLTLDKGKVEHPLPLEKLDPSGSIKHRVGALKGDTELRSAAISKKHLEQGGGEVNDRVDRFRVVAAKGLNDIKAATDETSLYKVSVTLISVLSKLLNLQGSENTQIPINQDQYAKLDKVVKDVRKDISNKVQQFSNKQKGQMVYNWNSIDKGLDTIVRKGDFSKDYEKLIKAKKFRRMEVAPGEHYFALDQSSYVDKNGVTHWVIYTKKPEKVNGRSVGGGNLSFVKEFADENIWPEPLPDVRKGIRPAPLVWVNNQPQYGTPLPKADIDRKRITLPDGRKVGGILFDQFLKKVGDKIIFDVIKAKYWEDKKGVQNFDGFKIDLDKLKVAPYGLLKGAATTREVQTALHQKKQKAGTPSAASSASTAPQSSTSSQSSASESEEEEF